MWKIKDRKKDVIPYCWSDLWLNIGSARGEVVSKPHQLF